MGSFLAVSLAGIRDGVSVFLGSKCLLEIFRGFNRRRTGDTLISCNSGDLSHGTDGGDAVMILMMATTILTAVSVYASWSSVMVDMEFHRIRDPQNMDLKKLDPFHKDLQIK